MSRVQLALNVNDIDEAVSFYTELFGTERPSAGPATPTSPSPSRRSSWSCWRTPAGRHPEPPRRRGRRRQRGRRRAGPARPGRPGRGGRARHHLLLRPAGQVLGHRRPRRRAVGDLHRPGRRPHLLGPGQRTALGRRPSRTRSAPAGQATQCCGGPQVGQRG